MSSNRVKQLFTNPVSLVILLSVIQLIIALLAVNLAFTAEESMWHYIGRNWFRNGLTPYAGGIDNKSPFIFIIFGVSDKLFGVNYWFPRLLGTICQSIGLLYVYKIGKTLSGTRAAVFAATLYGLSLMWKTTGGVYVSFTETYEVTFIIIAFYVQLTATNYKHYFVSGLMGGIALGFKLSACFGIAAMVLFSFKKGGQSALSFLAGLFSCLFLIALTFYFCGIDLNEVVVNAFTDNFGAGSTTDHTIAWRMDRFLDSFFYAEIILFYPFVAIYFLLAKKFNFLTIWLVCTFIGINALGIYARNHFKDILPVLSLMSGIALAALTDTYNVPFKALLIMVWLVFFPKIIQPLVGFNQLLFPARYNGVNACASSIALPGENAERNVGLWLKYNTLEEDKVFVAGYGARVQAYSERISPTGYFNVTQTAMAKKILFNDLEQNKPAWILIPGFPEYTLYIQEDIRTFIATLVAKKYSFQNCLNGYNIYKRINP